MLGDQVIVRVAQEGRSRGSDVPGGRRTFWFTYGMRDGKVVTWGLCTPRASRPSKPWGCGAGPRRTARAMSQENVEIVREA